MADLEQEIVDLHRFFEDWFRGTAEEGSLERFTGALAPEFTLISPGGEQAERAALIERIRAARGVRGGDPSFAIRIENVRARPLAAGLNLVHYEEWQTWGGAARGRLSSAILRDSDQAPGGLLWESVQETWLPELR